jgi:carboxyl-terminal processing protease
MSIRRGSGNPVDVTVTRAIIEIPTVRHAMIPGNIGYLQISQFTPNTGPQVRQVLFDFQQQGYTGLVIDVRSNPGGLLSAVVDVSDLFFDRGTVIVTTHSRIPGESRTYEARTRAIVDQSLPIAVLIDRYSASAAEILTGAFQDLNRARVFGEKSFGKGSVQQVVPIETGGFRLTTSRYHTPSGASIDLVGITPDQVVQPREYSDEEIASIRRLVEEDTVRKFVSENPNPSERRVEAFIDSLVKDGILLREERIRKSVRDEVNRKNNNVQIYDLDYDTVLREAVGYLQSR